jgi:folylpolyglutamate synthase/dihydropteroate synthase
MIQPGLERISLLLKDAEFPWKAIHVAGTNGKGSICHYASALFKRRTVRAGKFSSPHLVNRYAHSSRTCNYFHLTIAQMGLDTDQRQAC